MPRTKEPEAFTPDEVAQLGAATPAERAALLGQAGAVAVADDSPDVLRQMMHPPEATSQARLDAGKFWPRAQNPEMAEHFRECPRLPYRNPDPMIDRVEVNGYLFEIKLFTQQLLPEEVIFQLENRGRHERRYDVLSGVYAARQAKPVARALDVRTLPLQMDDEE